MPGTAESSATSLNDKLASFREDSEAVRVAEVVSDVSFNDKSELTEVSSKLEDDSKGEEDVVKVDLPSLFEETRELSSRDDVGLDRLVDD